MSILFVCHSTDALSLIATARELLKESKENILFLAIGNTAWTHLQQQAWFAEYPQIKSTSLVEIFDQQTMDALEVGAFNESQRNVMRDFYQKEDVTRGLIGTPPQTQPNTAFQIAEDLVGSKLCNRVCIFANYLYIESDSACEQLIANSEAIWCRQITWLLPVSQVRDQLLQGANIKPENVVVVGDPAAQKYILDQISPSSASKKVREEYLKVLNEHPLLFVSGSKDCEADLKLLKGLMEELKKSENNGITVRIGIHPDLEGKNINKYIDALLTYFDELSDDENVKLVINDYILTKGVSPRLMQHRTILKVGDLKNEDAAAAADSVITATPSETPLSVSVTRTHRLLDGEEKPTADVAHFYSGSESVPLFFNDMRTRGLRPAGYRRFHSEPMPIITAADSAKEVVAQVLKPS